MKIRVSGTVIAAALAAVGALSAFQVTRAPEDELVGIVTAYLKMSLPADWPALEKLPNLEWAALPPTSLTNCLPDGGCFTRVGTATVGGRNLTVMATGARTMVLNLYFRNTSAPLGEAAVVAALKRAALSADLVRCPIKGGAGSTNWYRLKGASLAPAHLSIQAPGPGRPGEGFVLTPGEELPPLQPKQLALYSEQCGAGAVQKPVSTTKPHEQLAQIVTTLLAQSSGPTLYDWKALAGLPTEITWNAADPKPVDYTSLGDPNPYSLSGYAAYAGRKFSMWASGTATQVKTIHFDEQGLHPKGEHLLGVVYEKGIAVQLVRCGPVYTESTNNWYSLTSSKTRPAMIRQSIRYEGNNVQDSYELRLDGSLPARDPRDRNPGANGC